MALEHRPRQDFRVPTAWILRLATGVFAFGIYFLTLAPSITWRNQGIDSGDLVAAAFTFGIPHPSGYPLYTLVAGAFAHLPIGDPARNVNLFSTLTAAVAIILLSICAQTIVPAGRPRWVNALASSSAALAFAFAPGFWSQATIAELYALSSLFAITLLYVVMGRSRHRLGLAALILGLGLTHHLTIVFFIPSVIVMLSETRWHQDEIIWACILFFLPLLLYLYLPFRAAADPPVNWGNPATFDGFLWTVTGAAYHSYLFNLTTTEALTRAAVTARFLFQQYNVWGVALGLWGLTQMLTNPQPRVRRQFIALILAFFFFSAYAVVYITRNSFVYFLTAYAIFAIWIAYGIGDLAGYFSRQWTRIALAIAVIALPAFNLVTNFTEMDLSQDRAAVEYAERVFSAMPQDAVVVVNEEKPLFGLWYYRYVVARESSNVIIVHTGLLQFAWYYDQISRMMPTVLTTSAAQIRPNYLARLSEIINASLANGRAVYTTEQADWLRGYSHQPRGDLIWIQAQRP